MVSFKRSRQPSSFPKLAFFGLRFVQLLCSLCVIGVLAFFLYHLWKDGYRTPYEFTLLDFAAIATLLNIVVTSVLLCCCGLSPLYVIIIDSLLTGVWIVGFALLLKAMGSTVTEQCTVENWGNDSGVRVCHSFKLLVAASAISVIAFVGMVITAIVARRKYTSHKYIPANNPANMRSMNTAYGGHDSLSSDTTPLYGAHPPAAYNPPVSRDSKPVSQDSKPLVSNPQTNPYYG